MVGWGPQRVHDTFTDEDAARIPKIKPVILNEDTDVWGFTKDGIYTTQSAYKMLSVIHNASSPTHHQLPQLKSNCGRIFGDSRLRPRSNTFCGEPCLALWLWQNVCGPEAYTMI